ncbi:MAG: orotidine-5'-phosphate decarboxylase [Butyrivibrio sp.]|nr:orotidine-5'-phosphate decarboxylase [Butyrivibrio sp.]
MIQRLVEGIKKTEAPIVVGLDPKTDFIPKRILDNNLAKYGESAEAVAESFFEFNKEIVDNIYDLVPAVKPQVAMYEQYGIPGLIAYKKTIDYCREKGLLVIADVKRGDIGSTSESYALAHLGASKVGNTLVKGFDADFATVNPYLGSDGVKPFVSVCNEFDKGIFVLVKTSNPSSGELQDKITDEKPLYELVGSLVEKWGAESMDGAYSNIGAVVGATYPEMGKVLRDIMPHAFILVPGYGAQGGKGADLVNFFDKDGLGAIVNSSRGIIAAWKNEKYADPSRELLGEAARKAVLDMKEDIKGALLNR